jgi:DNA-directed RNA polymerase specialized sigma24 family protein
MPADPKPGRLIFRVTHNAVVDYYRRRRFPLLPAGFDRPDDAPACPIGSSTMSASGRPMSYARVARPPARRDLSALLRGPPYESIASVMGIPSATARSLVHRGLQRLASVLDEETDR